MTGRAAGDCGSYSGAQRPRYAGFYPGRGFGLGRGYGWGGGWGRGWFPRRGRWFGPGWGGFPAYGPPAPPSREQEAGELAAQAEWLQGQLDDISQRLAELEDQEEQE